MRRKNLLLTLLLLLLAILTGTAYAGYHLYTRLKMERKKVNQDWEILAEACQNKLELLDQLIQLPPDSLPVQPVTKTELRSLRLQATRKVGEERLDQDVLNEFLAAQSRYETTLLHTFVAPVVTPEQNRILNQVHSTQKHVEACLHQFLLSVDAFNHTVARFPFSWVASLTGIKKINFEK